MKSEHTIKRSAVRTITVRLAGLGALLALAVASVARADALLVTSASDERNWSMVYNSQQHEYLLGVSQSGIPVVQRVASDGTQVGAPVAPWLAAGFYGIGEIQLAYNPHANQYLAVMSGQFPLPPGQPVVFAAVLDANAALVGAPVMLSSGNTSTSYDANRHYRTINAAFNTLANEYLVTYQMGNIYSQRIAESGALPAGRSTVISGKANGSHAIAYGSVVSPETPTGRYLLVNFSPNAPTQAEGLTMLGSSGQFLTNGIPFDWGVSYNASGGGGQYSPDVVYAELPPPDGRKVFVVVWEDEDNYDYWNPGLVRRGVWGGWLPAAVLGYSQPVNYKDLRKAFYLDGDYYNPGPPFMWDPRITYDASTGLFYMVSRHTPMTGYYCPGTPLNYHISRTSFDGSGLAWEVYPAGSGDCNGTGFPVSAMTGTSPGDQQPRHPTLAVGGPGKLLIAWDDARNSGSGKQRDLYGTLILPPANDQCSGALPLAENVYSTVSTTNATDDGASTCLGVTRTRGVWFTYTPAQFGTATVDTCPSDFDTAIEIFTGTCGNLTSIGCNNDSPGCSVTNRASYSFP